MPEPQILRPPAPAPTMRDMPQGRTIPRLRITPELLPLPNLRPRLIPWGRLSIAFQPDALRHRFREEERIICVETPGLLRAIRVAAYITPSCPRRSDSGSFFGHSANR